MKGKWQNDRNKIIGLGDNSFKKSYYPELQNKIKELEATNQNLNTIFNSTSDCFVIHDIDGNILMTNKQCEKLFQLCSQNNTLNNIHELINQSTIKIDTINLWNKVQSGESEVIQLAFKQKNRKKKRYIESSISKVSWYDKIMILEVIRDVTDQVYYEFELKKAKEKAEESDKLKTSFLANMSHEIRTPMNGILGFADLLNHDDSLNSEAKNYASIIQSNSERLLKLIGELIDISKIESGVVIVNKETINLNETLHKLNNFFQVQAKKKNINLTFTSYLDEAESILSIDRLKIEQVLTNLISNAIKFTPKGEVNFGCKLKNKLLYFWVKDSGIGISEQSQKLIFNRFYQVRVSDTEPGEGSGLGLAISKAIIELMNGDINVESVVGVGSVFTITIPLEKNKTKG